MVSPRSWPSANQFPCLPAPLLVSTGQAFTSWQDCSRHRLAVPWTANCRRYHSSQSGIEKRTIHAGTRLEVRHASAQPMVDRAGTNVEAPGDLPLADPSAACVVSAPKPQRFPVWNVVTETSPRGRGFVADMNPIDLVFEGLPAAFQSKVILWELEDPTPQPEWPRAWSRSRSGGGNPRWTSRHPGRGKNPVGRRTWLGLRRKLPSGRRAVRKLNLMKIGAGVSSRITGAQRGDLAVKEVGAGDGIRTRDN